MLLSWGQMRLDLQNSADMLSCSDAHSHQTQDVFRALVSGSPALRYMGCCVIAHLSVSDHSALSGLQHPQTAQWWRASCMLCVSCDWYPGHCSNPFIGYTSNVRKPSEVVMPLRPIIAPRIFLDLRIFSCLVNMVMVCSLRWS